MASPPPPNETQNLPSSASTITTLPPDIIHTHILTRFDGATLATASSVSSHLRHLCTDEDLWQKISTAMWPSLVDPIASHVISTFPNGHGSIFTDAFPSLHHFSFHTNHRHRPYPPPSELISAVDIYYQEKPIFSRIQPTETNKNWFLSSPLWVNVLQPNELVPTPVRFVRKDDEWMKHLQENFTLSWIVINPTRKRAANLSSRKPVSVQRHWLTRDLEVVYAVVLAGEKQRSSSEVVQCVVKVTCCVKVGGELHVKEVSMVMEDMEGRHMTGKESVMILQNAIENGERKKVDEVGAKERFEKFSCMMKERREMRHRREKARDVVSMVLALIAFLLFCCLACGFRGK